jgi:TatA/E family protein of Tat protein translocase
LFNIGPTELIVILVLALVVFGPKRLPEIGRTVGKSLREFRRATDEIKDELNMNVEDELPGDQPAPGEPGYENWKAASDPPPSGNGATEASTVAAVAAATGSAVDPDEAAVSTTEAVPTDPAAESGSAGTPSTSEAAPMTEAPAETVQPDDGAAGANADPDGQSASWGWWPEGGPARAGRAEEAPGGQAG